MKKLMIGSLIGLAALIAALGLLSSGTVAYAAPPDTSGVSCTFDEDSGIKQHGTVIIGTNGPDIIDCRASTVSLRILGLGGNDTIDGGFGDDFIDGGRGDDQISGHDGDDTLRGGPGNDITINGGNGDDTIDGGGGQDECYGNDELTDEEPGDSINNCELPV